MEGNHNIDVPVIRVLCLWVDGIFACKIVLKIDLGLLGLFLLFLLGLLRFTCSSLGGALGR
jgi:hypothetical protein